MVAENANLDVSDALKLTAATNNRELNKEDFRIGETRFTYAGNQATHGVSVTPTSENSGKFEIDMVRYKKKRIIQETSSESRRQPVYMAYLSLRNRKRPGSIM